MHQPHICHVNFYHPLLFMVLGQMRAPRAPSSTIYFDLTSIANRLVCLRIEFGTKKVFKVVRAFERACTVVIQQAPSELALGSSHAETGQTSSKAQKPR